MLDRNRRRRRTAAPRHGVAAHEAHEAEALGRADVHLAVVGLDQVVLAGVSRDRLGLACGRDFGGLFGLVLGFVHRLSSHSG